MSLCLTSCVTKKKVDLSPTNFEQYLQEAQKADSLYEAGSYTSLKEAYNTYEKILAIQFEKEEIAEKLLKTALLLGLRVKELGIFDTSYLLKAEELSATYPHLAKYGIYLKFIACIPYSVKGIGGGFLDIMPNLNDYYDWVKENVKPLNEELKTNAGISDFFAYMYVCFYRNFSHFIDEKLNMAYYLDLFPDSIIIKYRLALFLNKDRDLFESILEEEPRFQEVHLFLGESAYEGKKLLTAEKHFRKAYDIIPKSLSLLVYLAGIHFALEEYDESIGLYEDALRLAPGYREAILGKGICLGYMGKHEYALLTLNKLIELGKYYMGEAYFWLAWNQNELEQIETAEENVKKTENYLVGDIGVLALQGIISFKLGKLAEAEDYLNQALKIQNNHCESIYYLAKIDVLREDWKQSGIDYEKAAFCYRGLEAGLDNRIQEIEKSPLSLERKAKMILRKRAQLRQTALTKATCFYNGAAGFFNSGLTDKALVFAAYAAQDEAFTTKAEKLIKKIENR
ncbi:MAG: hypothetical protein PVI66_17395 [Candidatus Aminicenantes bacterium]